MKKLENLILITNTTKYIDSIKLNALISYLFALDCRISMFDSDRITLADMPEHSSRISEYNPNDDYDAAIVLGGDGSIIEAAHRLLDKQIPLIGINFGHIGFLTELDAGEFTDIGRAVMGEYTADKRIMLDAVVRDANGEIQCSYTVLNDAVITNGPIARLIGFDIYCDDVKTDAWRADGIIVATPTGSTAYSLSAGGPVLDPSLECICLTPICPHTLSSRPIIFHAGTKIRIGGIKSNNSTVYLNADGRDAVKLQDDWTIEIKKSSWETSLIRIKSRSFIDVLHSKLSEK